MKKNVLMRLCTLALAAALALFVFVSCNNEQGGTESTTDETTVETDSQTGATTTDGTSDNTENTTETNDNNTTEATTEETTEVTTEDPGTEACEHPYAAVPEGHWKPACDVCGKPDGKILEHEYSLDVEDEGDLLMYSFYCDICRYVAYEQEVSYDVNLFISPYDLMNSAVSGYNAGEFVFENGIGFTRFEANGAMNAHIVAADKSSAANIPTGKYAIMKIRTGGSRTSVRLNVSSPTAIALGAGGVEVVMNGISTGWSTVLVDLTTVVTGNSGYIADASGDYFLNQFIVAVNGVGAGEYVDIAYVAFCDNLSLAHEFAGKGYYKYMDLMSSSQPEIVGTVCSHKYEQTDNGHFMKACDICGSIGSAKEEPHEIGEISENGKYRYGCLCGYTISEMIIPDTTDTFHGLDYMNGAAAVYYQITNTGKVYDKDGSYMRFTGQGKVAQIIYSRMGSDHNGAFPAFQIIPFDVGEANYFVVKMRASNIIASLDFKLGTVIGDATYSNAHNMGTASINIPMEALSSGEWVTFVINLEDVLGSGWLENENGAHRVVYYQFTFNHAPNTPFSEQTHFDFAYMAFVNEWQGVKDLVTDDSVQVIYASNCSAEADTETGMCKAEHATTIVQENGIQKLICTLCGAVVSESKIPDNVNLYLLPAHIQSNSHYNVSGTKIMTEDGVSFVKLSSSMPTHMHIYSASAGAGSAKDISNSGHYLVMKLRTNNMATIWFSASTGDNPVTQITRPSSTGGNWETMVISLEQFYNYSTGVANTKALLRLDGFAAVDGQEYSVDIAYVAVVDTLEDAASIIEESTFNYYADWTQAPVVYNTETHQPQG